MTRQVIPAVKYGKPTHSSRQFGGRLRSPVLVVRVLEHYAVTDPEIATVTTRIKKKRLTLDPARFEQNVCVPEYLDEVWDFPDGTFSLVRDNRETASGSRSPTLPRARLYWIKLRDLRRFMRLAEPRVMQAITSRAIPPEGYRPFGVLRSQ